MKDLGAVVSKHGTAGALKYLLNGLAVMFIGLGVFVLYFAKVVDDPAASARFWRMGWLLSGFGAALFPVYWFCKPKETFVLHERGIEAIARGGRKEAILFAEVQHVQRLKFARVPISVVAFRTAPGQRWRVFGGNISGNGVIGHRVVEAFTSEHLPGAMARIGHGERLDFPYKKLASRLAARYFAWSAERAAEAATEPVTLDRTSVSFSGQTFSISRMANLEVSDWTGQLTIRDAAGDAVLSLNYLALYNADLFIAVLEGLIERARGCSLRPA